MITILCFAIAGCAGPAPTDRDAGVRFLSLTPESLGRPLSLSQLVTGEHDGNTYRIRYEVDITRDRLAIVGLSPLGITLFSIIQKGHEVVVETQFGGQPAFDPRYTLFDLYLTYWPPDKLRTALARIGMILDESEGNPIRRVRGEDGRLIATLTYAADDGNKSATMIEHFDFPYRLRIVTLAQGGDR